MKTEILFLTHNRRQYATLAWETMLQNTDWSRVSKLWLFDDSSTDGVQDLVSVWQRRCPTEAEVVKGNWGSPVTAMSDFIGRAIWRGSAEFLAKIDSDVMLPPGWLGDCLTVLSDHPEVNLLGIEARGNSAADSAPSGTVRLPTPSEWIGGIGVFRREAFLSVALPCREPGATSDRKFFGWQAWQMRFPNQARAAWLSPSLQVFLLDRLPLAPWDGLGKLYVRAGWQRAAPYYYGEAWAGLWEWSPAVNLSWQLQLCNARIGKD